MLVFSTSGLFVIAVARSDYRQQSFVLSILKYEDMSVPFKARPCDKARARYLPQLVFRDRDGKPRAPEKELSVGRRPHPKLTQPRAAGQVTFPDLLVDGMLFADCILGSTRFASVLRMAIPSAKPPLSQTQS